MRNPRPPRTTNKTKKTFTDATGAEEFLRSRWGFRGGDAGVDDIRCALIAVGVFWAWLKHWLEVDEAMNALPKARNALRKIYANLEKVGLRFHGGVQVPIRGFAARALQYAFNPASGEMEFAGAVMKQGFHVEVAVENLRAQKVADDIQLARYWFGENLESSVTVPVKFWATLAESANEFFDTRKGPRGAPRGENQLLSMLVTRACAVLNVPMVEFEELRAVALIAETVLPHPGGAIPADHAKGRLQKAMAKVRRRN